MKKKEVKYNSLQDLNALKQQMKHNEIKGGLINIGVKFEALIGKDAPPGVAFDIDSIPDGKREEVFRLLDDTN